MTKNVLLLQYAEQTEPSSFINCMSTPCGTLFFANGRFLYYILQELIFCDELNLVFLVLFLNVLWIQDVYKLKGFFFYKFSSKPSIEWKLVC